MRGVTPESDDLTSGRMSPPSPPLVDLSIVLTLGSLKWLEDGGPPPREERDGAAGGPLEPCFELKVLSDVELFDPSDMLRGLPLGRRRSGAGDQDCRCDGTPPAGPKRSLLSLSRGPASTRFRRALGDRKLGGPSCPFWGCEE